MNKFEYFSTPMDHLFVIEPDDPPLSLHGRPITLVVHKDGETCMFCDLSRKSILIPQDINSSAIVWL